MAVGRVGRRGQEEEEEEEKEGADATLWPTFVDSFCVL